MSTRTIEVVAMLIICCLFKTAHIIKPNTEIIRKVVPQTPKNPAAILGKPFIIPL